MPSEETLILKNGIIVTMDNEQRIIEDGSIVTQGNKIIDVNKAYVIEEKKYKVDNIIDAKGKAILPGLISLHHHSSIATRGIMEQMGLEEFLDKVYYPTLSSLKKEEAYTEAMLAYAEAIKTGTTCVNDMYRHIIQCAKAAEDIGIRAVLSSEAADKIPGQETLDDNKKAFIQKNGAANGRIKIWFGIEWVPVNSTDFILKTRELADKYKTGVHIHLNESIWEVEWCKKEHGKRPVEYTYDLGLLKPDVVAAHCVWLSDREITILRETGAHVSHNPVSNMKLGNGPARLPELFKAGVNVGVGPDAPVCNNNLDLFETMKMASILHKGVKNDATLIPPEVALRMATVNGAKALGLEKDVGSIESGKKADVILVDLMGLRMTPTHFSGRRFNLYANLVYSAHGDDVVTSIIDGKIIMENRILKTVDEAEIVKKAYEVSNNILDRLSYK